jgi:hypothetical protein
MDFYAIMPPGYGRDISSQGYFVRKMLDIGEAERKPAFIFLQTYGAHEKLREPTPEEQEAQTYLCVIEGGRGINYFISLPQSEPSRKRLFDIYKELKSLIPALFSPVQYRFEAANSQHIKCLAAKTKKGWYIITINESPHILNATLNISKTGIKNGKAKVLFEDRSVDIKNGIIKDNYPKYKRHVYFVEETE